MLYGTLEGNIKLVLENHEIKLKVFRELMTHTELTLTDYVYSSNGELARELLGMAMQIIDNLEGEDAMIEAIQSELTDNYDTSKKEYRIEVK